MAVNHREMLSALVDGQLSGQELDTALALIASDSAARSDFLRYQQSSDFIHGYTRGAVDKPIDLTQRISAALATEPAYKASPLRKANILRFPARLWKQAGGLAVAASIGALAVVGVNNQPGFQQQDAAIAAIESVAPQTARVTTQVANQVNRWTVGEPEVEDRLNSYLVDHSEYSAGTGMFSYGRVVSYGTEQ